MPVGAKKVANKQKLIFNSRKKTKIFPQSRKKNLETNMTQLKTNNEDLQTRPKNDERTN